ncbi:multicopper oxidase family protein [Aureibacter tunicatorum]|uniref:FtsP/CotA-like multicopper oxidase with cupredoxin domain n=1 Tax=Aureibacter tunicatorum TaxID=866807 RepID=A0AAE4BRU9_9BACT|nr:multicopper oxidase domain-containing protein [Aureibacter tunicatorum]MDR6238225.1 FtsP/CotA-like multicopper oxidase with cupredoxin domain [Aureibacter tunicatorum]BDD03258.1 hypothetical protein AUTU_07410 [Aureibacter tunicatorum]
MDRRKFLSSSLLASGLMINPNEIFSEAYRKENLKKFPRQLEYNMDGDWKEFHLTVDIDVHEPAYGMKYHTLLFNNQLPGPEIRVNKGDKVRVYFHNNTILNHTIHWHGLHTPWRMDGVPFVNQFPVMPNNTFVYEFVAEPTGTHFYHCHWGTVMHMQAGMYGSFIIEDPDDPIKKRFPYDREYVMVYSAHDVNFIREEMNRMLYRMKERSYLMKNGRYNSERWDTFDSIEDFENAVNKGYKPPYLVNRRAPADLPQPNWFTINGKSYPYAPELFIKEGEKIRVRLINAGNVAYYLHLHGHDFWQVADDGRPLPDPNQANTIPLMPGKTNDIIIEGNNRGIWTFHDHDTRKVTNNGVYPGGTLTTLVYEDLPPEERDVVKYSGNINLKKMAEQGHKLPFDGGTLPKYPLDE